MKIRYLFFATFIISWLAFPAAAEEKLASRSPEGLQQELSDLESRHEAAKYQAYLESIRPGTGTAEPAVSPELAKQRAFEKSLKETERQAERERRRIIRRWHGKESVREWFDQHPNLSRLIRSAFVRGPSTALSRFVNDWVQEPVEPFVPSAEDQKKFVQFLRENVTESGLPLSYQVPPGYWSGVKQLMEVADASLERIITQYGLSLYDGALWQIAMLVAGSPKDRPSVYAHTDRLLSGTSGELRDIRAFGPLYLYGADKKIMDRDNAYFFRIIADQYIQEDPILGLGPVQGFPNFETPHHEDWKPIMGEQAWAAIIGPIQTAYKRYHGQIPLDSPEVRLAMSIVEATEAMQSEIGGIYHAPEGTFGKNPDDISNENNFSMYAALGMLAEVLRRGGDAAGAERIEVIRKKQEDYIARYAFDRVENIFYQGGLYKDGQLHPALIFALDCQTWGILAMGPEWIDKTFGEGAAYRIWVRSKQRSGFMDKNGNLTGVGFSDGHRILSVEWTAGAILATRILAEYYRPTQLAWSRELARDAELMRRGCEEFKTAVGKEGLAYLYANKRYFIPFSWWANPIPSMASTAWIILIDAGYNPFILGGGLGEKSA